MYIVLGAVWMEKFIIAKVYISSKYCNSQIYTKCFSSFFLNVCWKFMVFPCIFAFENGCSIKVTYPPSPLHLLLKRINDEFPHTFSEQIYGIRGADIGPVSLSITSTCMRENASALFDMTNGRGCSWSCKSFHVKMRAAQSIKRSKGWENKKRRATRHKCKTRITLLIFFPFYKKKKKRMGSFLFFFYFEHVTQYC